MPATLRVNPSQPDDRPLERAATVVRQGGIIVYPTETLYGIGGNALLAGAVEKVQGVKRRLENKPVLVIVRSVEEVARVAREITECARGLMEAFWPGPVTLVLKSAEGLPAGITAGTGSVGVRIPSSPVALRLLALCGCPLTSTSANLAGKRTPRTIDEIRAALGPGVDLFLDAGELPESKPSTVVDATGDQPRLLREGVIPFEQILHVHSQSAH